MRNSKVSAYTMKHHLVLVNSFTGLSLEERQSSELRRRAQPSDQQNIDYECGYTRWISAKIPRIIPSVGLLRDIFFIRTHFRSKPLNSNEGLLKNKNNFFHCNLILKNYSNEFK